MREFTETVWALKVKDSTLFLGDREKHKEELDVDEFITEEIPTFFFSSKEKADFHKEFFGFNDFEVVEIEITYKVK